MPKPRRPVPNHERLPPNLDELFPPSPENVQAVLAIQSHIRGREARRSLSATPVNVRASVTIQAHARGMQARRSLREKKRAENMSLIDSVITSKTAQEAHDRSRRLIDPRRSKFMGYW